MSSFDVDEWDEKFINEIFQVELGLCSKNAVNHAEPPLPPNFSSYYPPEQKEFLSRDLQLSISSDRRGKSSSGFGARSSVAQFSPPRELSQRFKEPIGVDCMATEVRILKNRLGGSRKNKEEERLKWELEHLSKKFTNMEQDCIILKKDRDQKNEQLKCVAFQLEAKEAEIRSLRNENLTGYNQSQLNTSTFFDKNAHLADCAKPSDSKFKTIQTDKSAVAGMKWRIVTDDNESAVAGMKRRIVTDDNVTISYHDQECFLVERSTKSSSRDTRGIQTDDIQDSINIAQQKRVLNEQGIVSKLHAIWGLHDKRSGSNLASKLLGICSADFFALFRCSNILSKCNLNEPENESFSAITAQEGDFSHSSDADKVFWFYQLIMKEVV